MTITAFYKFVDLPDYRQLQKPLLKACNELGIQGTILLAAEGINGTIAGSDKGIAGILNYIKSDKRLADLVTKESYSTSDKKVFYRMKVRLKKEIVALGVDGINPNEQVGTYVEPEDWNQLISDPDVLLVDTRNDYEYEVGTFQGAVDPHTTSFRQFPKYVKENLNPKEHQKVAMFCTGGIRCEKATAFMLKQGFKEVYHLKGGILKYLEDVPKQDSMWNGECYVFDNRVAVNHNLDPGSFDLCFACRRPLSQQEKESPDYRAGVSCSRCIGEFSDQDRERFAERARQIVLAKERGEEHVGSIEMRDEICG